MLSWYKIEQKGAAEEEGEGGNVATPGLKPIYLLFAAESHWQ